MMLNNKFKYLIPFLCGVLVFTMGLFSVLFVDIYNIDLLKILSIKKIPKAFLIMSGSMEPSIKVGSVVFTLPSKVYQRGDVITFYSDGKRNNVVTHRIKEKKFTNNINREPSYTTSGDANKSFDNQEIKDSNIVGKVVFTIPYIGYFANFAKTPKGFILFIIIPATIIIYEELRFLGLELKRILRIIKSRIIKKEEVKERPLLSERTKLPIYVVLIPIFGTFLIFIAMSSSFFTDKAGSLRNILGAASSFSTTIMLENKRTTGNWAIITNDGIEGSLKYTPEGSTFDYEFQGKGLQANKLYCLIYYADPWPGNNPGELIDKGTSSNLGIITLIGNKDFGISIPQLPDLNYSLGAKVWLIPCANYNESNHRVEPWAPNNSDWLFETGWINYKRVLPTITPSFTPIPTNTPTPSPTATASPTPSPIGTTIEFESMGAGSQFGYVHDYSGANVNFSYQSPESGRLSGVIVATGLKPYGTYQLKLEGIPTCQDSSGNDSTNEKIGYKGRWWDNTSNSNLNDSPSNNDIFYLANSIYHGGTRCITGYLVWDFITADSDGNVTKNVETNNSYHVLWCGGGTCNTSNNNNLQNLEGATPPGFPYCASGDVNGQLERSACGSLSLDTGNYHLKVILNEESFHQSGFGTWTAVMSSMIDFQVD